MCLNHIKPTKEKFTYGYKIVHIYKHPDKTLFLAIFADLTFTHDNTWQIPKPEDEYITNTMYAKEHIGYFSFFKTLEDAMNSLKLVISAYESSRLKSVVSIG